MSTGFVWHERYMWHDTGHAASYIPSGGWLQPDEHVENPETKRRLRNLLEVSGLLDRLVPIKPSPAPLESVYRVHTREYVAQLEALDKAGGGPFGENCVVGPGSYDVALLAVGGVIAAAEAVLRGDVTNAYALVRPCGHHAEAARARGFCLLGNVAVAAKHVLASGAAERIAVVDWDVHHGNGTQWAFYDDPRVLTISLHQDRNYPQECGFVDEVGEGEGRGFNINVPLPPGSGEGAYLAAFDQVVEPAVDAFAPELVFIACGLDAGGFDPLAHMMLHSEVFRQMTERVKALAEKHCSGRVVASHEGGYSTAYVPFCGVAVIEALAGERSAVEDPFLSYLSQFGGQDLQPHQQEVISRAAGVVELLRSALAGD